MNKKQKNRKIVAQNKRNKTKNRRYKSLIKILSKTLKEKILLYKSLNDNQDIESLLKIKSVFSKLFSIIDKASKKKVIHKNTAARKKSSLTQLIKFSKLSF